ncbi:MAG: hypothetical protein JO320_07985 [Alphaproteobacteria bacterium]|nr:hypothetical protein [Alphaproteobacteria bacterium]
MSKIAPLFLSMLLCTADALGAGPAHAAAGVLDPTFGQGGQVTISLPNNNLIIEDAVLQPDGKIAVAAMFTEIVADANASDSFGVVRLLPNGSLDPSFGMGGVTRIAFGNFDATPNLLALQPDSKIVVVGQGALLAQWVAARFNANGALDTSFALAARFRRIFQAFRRGSPPSPRSSSIPETGSWSAVRAGRARSAEPRQCSSAMTRTAASIPILAMAGPWPWRRSGRPTRSPCCRTVTFWPAERAPSPSSMPAAAFFPP